MNYDDFINKYIGQSIDFDGYYGAQCVDMVAQYCVENGKPVAYANAKDWWRHPALTDAFDFFDNDPNDPNQLPNRGDIIIWNGDVPGSEGDGHIAIWDMRVKQGVFQSLDQNWGGQYVHFIPNHTWDWVIGWMRPKAAPAPEPQPTPTQPEAPSEPTPDPVPVPEPVPVPTPDPTPQPVPEPTPEQPAPTPEVPTDPAPTPQPEPSPVPTESKTLFDVVSALFRVIVNFLKSFKKG